MKVRGNGRIVPLAVIVALGANTGRRRDVVGPEIGPSGADPVRAAFLRRLNRRGRRGVRLVIGDAPKGGEAAVSEVLDATWQSCRV